MMSVATRGRPSLYTEEIAAEICQRIAEGETLNQICRDEHMPARPTVVGWCLENREGFSDRYARARDLQLEHWADEVIDVADDATNDYMEKVNGEDEKSSWALNGEHVQRSRLRIDSRKWLLSKLKPERYGDKLQHTGDKENPISHHHAVEWVIVDPNHDVEPEGQA